MELTTARKPPISCIRARFMPLKRRSLLRIDGVRFKKPVSPGDQLWLEMHVERVRSGMWKFKGQATVDGEVVTEATIMCTIRMLGEDD